MPAELMQAMQNDYRTFMQRQPRGVDPEQLIQRAIRDGRVTPQQVEQARQMAARFGSMLR